MFLSGFRQPPVAPAGLFPSGQSLRENRCILYTSSNATIVYYPMYKPLTLFLSLLLATASPALCFCDDDLEPIHAKLSKIDPTPGEIVAVDTVDALELTTLTLSNGMRVVIKQIPEDSEEVLVRIVALGGFTAVPPAQRASAQLAPEIAWQSGFSEMSYREVTRLLAAYSIEVDQRVGMYDRTISGLGDPDTVDFLLMICHLLFIAHHFDRSSIGPVVKQTRESIRRQRQDCEFLLDEVLRGINTGRASTVRPLSEQQLESLSYDDARRIYKSMWTDPSAFYCIIVGDITVEEVKPSVLKFLASIPQPASPTLHVAAASPVMFPESIAKKTIRCGKGTENLTRISYPIVATIDQQTISDLEFTSQTIETRLREVVREEMGSTLGVDVAYEFPLFPYLRGGWLSVQYRSETPDVSRLADIIHREVQTLRLDGPSDEEVLAVRQLLYRSDRFWDKDNNYWLAMLTNYANWGWDFRGILDARDRQQHGRPPQGALGCFLTFFTDFKRYYWSRLYSSARSLSRQNNAKSPSYSR